MSVSGFFVKNLLFIADKKNYLICFFGSMYRFRSKICLLSANLQLVPFSAYHNNVDIGSESQFFPQF